MLWKWPAIFISVKFFSKKFWFYFSWWWPFWLLRNFALTIFLTYYILPNYEKNVFNSHCQLLEVSIRSWILFNLVLSLLTIQPYTVVLLESYLRVEEIVSNLGDIFMNKNRFYYTIRTYNSDLICKSKRYFLFQSMPFMFLIVGWGNNSRKINCFAKMYVNTHDPWITWGLGVLTLCIVGNPCITYSQLSISLVPYHIWNQTWILYIYYWKKSLYK